MGACPARGGRRVRGGCGGASDRRARGLRRQLRAGQSAPDQRPVRLSPVARPGARASPRRSRRPKSAPAIFRKPTRRTCSKSAAIIASWFPAPTRCRACSKSRSARPSAKRGVSVVVMPGDVALQPASDAPPAKVAGLLPAAPVVTPAKQDLERLAALLNGKNRVTILCGSGCQGAHNELLALARASQSADGPYACAARNTSSGRTPTTSA